MREENDAQNPSWQTYKFIQAEIDVKGVIQNEDYVETEAIGKEIVANYARNYDNALDSDELAAIIEYVSNEKEFWLVDSDGEKVDIGSKVQVSDVLSVGKTGAFAAGMGKLDIKGTVNVNKEGFLYIFDADVAVSGEVNINAGSIKGDSNNVIRGTLTVDGGMVIITGGINEADVNI